MIPEYLTGSHREGIEVPFRPFLFLIHVTLRCWLNAFHNANNWLRPLLWHYVPNINTLQRALAPLPRPIVAPSSLLGCLINVHQLFFHFFIFISSSGCFSIFASPDHQFNDLWTVIWSNYIFLEKIMVRKVL